MNRRAMISPRLALGLGIVAVCAAPAAARGDGLADEAELHFQIARRRFVAGDYEGALEHFFTSNRLVRNRNVLFNIGGTYEQMGRLPEAHRYYYAALEGETNARVIAEVTAAITRITPRVAVLNVTTEPGDAALFLDRRDLGERGRSGRPLALVAGTYRVIAEREGYEPATSEPITVAVGQQVDVSLSLRRIVGTIDVRAASGATVRLDDEARGPSCAAPCAIEVAPGPHTVYVARDGFASEARTVVVTAQQRSSLAVTLRPLVGTLVVEADERDALVEVDGRTAGFAPLVLRDVPVGRRRVRVSLSGFNAVEREVEVRATGEARVTDLSMAPVREIAAASRSVEQIEDAPASVSVVSAREIEAFQYTTIADAVQGTRGVYLSNDRAYTSVGIRGLGQPNDYGNRVLVQQDGATLNDNLLYSSYVGHDGRTSLDLVDRIEVVRGPGSLLYGTGAISGVINLALRDRDVRTGASVGISAYGDNMARARASGAVRISRDAGVMLGVSVGASQGVDVPVVLPGMMGDARVIATGVDRQLTGSVTGRAWWRDLSAQWHVAFQEHDIPVGAYGTTVNDHATRWSDGRALGEVRYEPKIGQQFQLFTRAHVNLYRFLGVYAYDDGSLSREAYIGLWTGGEARGVWSPIRALTITAGGEFQWHGVASLSGETTDRAMPSAPANKYLDVARPYSVGSGYALLDLHPVSWFRLTGGARVDAFSTVPAGVSFRAAMIFRPATRTTIKVMGGRAFRAPSIYEQAYSDGGATQAPGCMTGVPCALRPEVIYTGEIEVTQRIGESWSILGGLNTSALTDILDTTGDGTPTNLLRYQNGADAVLSVGGDLEVRREFRQGWFFAASYNVQHTRYLGTSYLIPGLVNAPDHQGSLKMVAPLIAPYANAAVRGTFVGPRRVQQSVEAWTTPAVLGDVVITGQVTRLGLRYSFGVYNVLDWRWDTPVTGTFASRTMQQSGRSFAVHLQASF